MWIEASILVAVLGQASLLHAAHRLSAEWWTGWVLGSFCCALLWRMRRLLTPHADMLLLMASFGGIGMLMGGALDGPVPVCHRDPWNPWTWMNAAMIVFGFAPSIPWSRCLVEARRSGALLPVMLFDAFGMWLGMSLSHVLLRPAPGRMLAPEVSHALMLVGMLLGMSATMALRRGFLRAWAYVVPGYRLLRFSTAHDTVLRKSMIVQRK